MLVTIFILAQCCSRNIHSYLLISDYFERLKWSFGKFHLMVANVSCKANNFQGCESSKTAVNIQSMTLAVDQVASSVVAEVL